jgi:hypothetical protein
MEFRITTSAETEYQNQLPDSLLRINRQNGSIVVKEYANSHLRFRNNVQAYLALTPFTMNGKRFFFQTFKDNWHSAESFQNWMCNRFASYMRNRVPTTLNYDHHIILFNTNGSWNEDELFRIVDAAYPINRILVAGCTLSPGHKIRVITSPNEHDVFIFTNNINHGIMLKVISILPLVCPSLAPDALLPETEEAYPIDMFIKLGNLDFDGWVALYTEWYHTSEEVRQRARMLINLIEIPNGYQETERQRVTHEIREIDRSVENYIAEIRNQYAYREDRLARLARLDNIENPMIELIEYLKKKKEIKMVERKNGTYHHLYFLAVQPVNIYDKEGLQSYINSPMRNHFNEGQLAPFYQDVFIDQKYMLYTAVAFNIDFHAYTVIEDGYMISPTYGIPNPHLMEYHCWGNNKALITQALGNQDFVVALEQALAAGRSFNFHDSPVMRRFRDHLNSGSDLYINPKSLLNVETGEWLSLRQYIYEGRR